MSENNSQEAANIFIRNLQPEDHEMLSKLRDILDKKSNTQAVMTAAYGYLDLLETKAELNAELRKAQMTIERYRIGYEALQRHLAQYFRHREVLENMEEELLMASTQNPLADEKDEEHE